MPVNGIELKEGQKWKTLSGRVATLEDSPREEPYVFRAVYKDGEWNTVTKDGKYWTSDYDSFLRELIYDPEQQVKDELNMKFNPVPGDKIICSNGEEFICCTLGFLQENIAKFISSDKPILGYGKYIHNNTWQDWDEHGNASYDNDNYYDIREVIPQSSEVTADKKEEVKEEPRYTVEEVFYAIKEHCGKYDSPLGCEFEIKNLLKRFDEDPEYKEYLRLKAIYE